MINYRIRIPSQLAAALRSVRKTRKLRQREAGELAGLYQKTVSLLENKPEHAKVSSLLDLVRALDAELIIRPRQQEEAAPSRDDDW